MERQGFLCHDGHLSDDLGVHQVGGRFKAAFRIGGLVNQVLFNYLLFQCFECEKIIHHGTNLFGRKDSKACSCCDMRIRSIQARPLWCLGSKPRERYKEFRNNQGEDNKKGEK